jgi:hypothetical protein
MANKFSFSLSLATLLVTVFFTATAHAYPLVCPDIPKDKPSNFSVYLVCKGPSPNCVKFEDYFGRSFDLDITTKIEMAVPRANVVYNIHDSPTFLDLDNDSFCLIRRMSGQNVGRVFAFVSKGKVIVAPYVKSEINRPTIQMNMGKDSTYELASAVCLEILPTCKVGNVQYISLREKYDRYKERFMNWIKGKDGSVTDSK